ncbi:MAG: SurA N-terminal domain-containing protein, partial [Bauldia sp.]
MLDRLRTAAGGIGGKVVMGLLVIGLAFFGITGIIGGGAGTEVATVGAVTIDANTYQRRYDLYVQQYSQSIGIALTPVLQEQLNVPTAALMTLVRDAAVTNEAMQLGLGISDAQLGRRIQTDPNFAPGGNFSRGTYDNFIAQLYGSERAYLAERRPQELRDQLESSLVPLSSLVASNYARLYYQYANELRDIAFVHLTEANLGPLPDPTEEQIAAYYAANTDAYNAPESRTARILDLTPAGLADPTTVTDEEVRVAYDDRLAELTSPETRRVWQQLISAEQATAIQAQLDAGQTFEQLVAAGTIAPAEPQLQPATAFTANPAVGEAGFAMALGETRIVAGRLGQTIVHVSEIVPGTTPPFEEVRETLRQTIAEERAVGTIPDLREQIEDARAAGATLAEVGERFGLATSLITVDAQGNDALGNPIADLPGGTALVNGIFASDIGLADPPIVARGGAVWFEVAEILPPHQRPLEEVRERVIADWRAADISTRLQQLAQQVLARLQAGEELVTVAAELGFTVETRADLTR